MNWPAIITAILQLVGPLLTELLQKWLDGALKAAADRLGPGLRPAAAGSADLFDEVNRSLWFWQAAKKRLVRECRNAAVPAIAAGRPLTTTEAGAVKAAALAA